MKIRVLSCFFGHCPYKDIFLQNITEYCGRHGYELIIKTEHENSKDNPYFNEKWFWWYNVTMIKENLPKCDYVMWVDMDCIILNMSIKIEDIIGEFDMAVTHEVHPETGTMIFRNSTWSNRFLNDWENWHDPETSKLTAHPALDNNYIVFCRMVKSYPVSGNIKFVSNTEFMIKHVHINDRTDETFVMHVPGSPMSHKVDYMTKHLKDVIR